MSSSPRHSRSWPSRRRRADIIKAFEESEIRIDVRTLRGPAGGPVYLFDEDRGDFFDRDDDERVWGGDEDASDDLDDADADWIFAGPGRDGLFPDPAPGGLDA